MLKPVLGLGLDKNAETLSPKSRGGFASSLLTFMGGRRDSDDTASLQVMGDERGRSHSRSKSPRGRRRNSFLSFLSSSPQEDEDVAEVPLLSSEVSGGVGRENAFTDLINAADIDGNTVFFYSVITGKSNEILDALVAFGANVNSRNRIGRTALHYLCMADIHPYFLLYKKKRVLVFHLNEKLRVPDLYLKVFGNVLSYIHLQKQHHKYRIKLEDISHELNYSSLRRVLRKLMDIGAEVNSYDNGGLLPIHYLVLASSLNENKPLYTFVRKLKRLIVMKKQEDIDKILLTFQHMDEMNRQLYLKYAFTLLLTEGSKLGVGVNVSTNVLQVD